MDKYVEHIITNLVRDTKIDFERDEVYYPSEPQRPIRYYPLLNLWDPIDFEGFAKTYPGFLHTFFKYCTNTYGLTVDEIKYVWNHYREVIKDKIDKWEDDW
jgi:hypothetical protein